MCHALNFDRGISNHSATSHDKTVTVPNFATGRSHKK